MTLEGVMVHIMVIIGYCIYGPSFVFGPSGACKEMWPELLNFPTARCECNLSAELGSRL